MRTAQPHVVTCSRCNKLRPVEARYLCRYCYDVARISGQLDNYPPKRRTRDNVIEAVERLRNQGLTWEVIAQRLHYADAQSAAQTYRHAKRRAGASS